MLDYACEIEYFDSQLAGMMQILEDRGLLENTIVVVTSDKRSAGRAVYKQTLG